MNFSSLDSSYYGELNGSNFIFLALILTEIWQLKFIIYNLIIFLNGTVWDSLGYVLGLEQFGTLKILLNNVPYQHCLVVGFLSFESSLLEVRLHWKVVSLENNKKSIY